MFKISRELEIHPIIKSWGSKFVDFGFCGEEYYIDFNGTSIKWDMLGKDCVYLYLIEIKINAIAGEELDLLNSVGQSFRSFKPIKVVLMTLPLSKRKKNRIDKYKYIKHIELEGIVYDPDMPMKKVEFSKGVDYDFKLLEKLACLKYEYFDFYLGHKLIYDKYILLEFKFKNGLGIILRFSILNSKLEYQLIRYIWGNYYDVRKIFNRISESKLNAIFEYISSNKYYSSDIRPEREKRLIQILQEVEK